MVALHFYVNSADVHTRNGFAWKRDVQVGFKNVPACESRSESPRHILSLRAGRHRTVTHYQLGILSRRMWRQIASHDAIRVVDAFKCLARALCRPNGLFVDSICVLCLPRSVATVLPN